MSPGLLTLAHLTAGGLFIFALGGLSRPDTAEHGIRRGLAGMALAVATILFHPDAGPTGWALLALGTGALVGLPVARRVHMTQMPEGIAALHALLGLAALLVGLSTFLDPGHALEGGAGLLHTLEVFATVTLGGITFAGSTVAWARLSGRLAGTPLRVPGRHALNAVAALTVLLLVIPTAALPGGTVFLVLAAGISVVLGAHLVAAIGGADMPVVVCLLHSYAGWTTAAAGFMLSHDLLILTGALVGSSGAILSHIMGQAMNRSLFSVVFGGFDVGAPSTAEGSAPRPAEVSPVDTDDLARLVREARDILIVPGYGLAVARAQAAVKAFIDHAGTGGARVRVAVHPVAGRLPGHMNLLLAEAGVPYDLVHGLDDLDDACHHTDLVLVLGANDIVNPAAQRDPDSPLYGMPVIEAWKARHCVVLKRSLNVGYTGVANPLFTAAGTRMHFGDARERLEALVDAL